MKNISIFLFSTFLLLHFSSTVFQYQAASVWCRKCRTTINSDKIGVKLWGQEQHGQVWRNSEWGRKSTGKGAGEYELIIIPEGAQQQLQGAAELQVHCEQNAITWRRLIWGLQSTCCRVSESGIQNESAHFHTLVLFVKHLRRLVPHGFDWKMINSFCDYIELILFFIYHSAFSILLLDILIWFTNYFFVRLHNNILTKFFNIWYLIMCVK